VFNFLHNFLSTGFCIEFSGSFNRVKHVLLLPVWALFKYAFMLLPTENAYPNRNNNKYII